MRVVEVMKSAPRVARGRHSLAEAGRLMVEVGCGVLPVVDAARSVCGVVTDRDICRALATSDRRASEVTVEETMTRDVSTCFEDDDVTVALRAMRERRVRRLPVVDRAGTLQGLLSLDDLAVSALEAGEPGAGRPDLADVARTLGAINEHRLPSLAGA